jgi:hypothetical protein
MTYVPRLAEEAANKSRRTIAGAMALLLLGE